MSTEPSTFAGLAALCPTSSRLGDFDPRTPGGNQLHTTYNFTYDPLLPYDPSKVGVIFPYDPANPDSWIGMSSGAPNEGRGFDADLSGNKLPNSPKFTLNIGAQYKIPLDSGRWNSIIRLDYYRQSKSFARIYNTDFDKIKS